MPTITGRAVNALSKRTPRLNAFFMRRQLEAFRASNGQRGNRLRGKPIFVLDVIGRKSGQPRPVMLMLVRRGDDLVVIGSNGGNPQTPNWWKNLMAAGRAWAEVPGERYEVTARELEGGPERDECWALAVGAYPDFESYQELTERRIPIAVLERIEQPSG